MAMSDAAAVSIPVSTPPTPALREGSASNISSPLSDVEDKDGDSDILDLDTIRKSTAIVAPGSRADNVASVGLGDSGTDDDGDGDGDDDGEDGDDDEDDDDDSNLSDVDLNDSEAETERLYDSPSKSKASSNSSTAHPSRIGTSYVDFREREFQGGPSKLNQHTKPVSGGGNLDNDGSSSEKDQSVSESSMTPTGRKAVHEPARDGNAPLVSADKYDRDNITADESKAPEDSSAISASDTRKRKRSPAAEFVEAGQPVKKRIGFVATGTVVVDDVANIGSTVDDAEATPANTQSVEHSEDDAVSAGRLRGYDQSRGKAETAHTITREVASPTRSKRSGANNEKHTRSRDTGDLDHLKNGPDDNTPVSPEGGLPAGDETGEGDADIDPDGADADGDADGDHEGDAEISHKDEEELERKKAAQEFILELEKSFAEFRDQYFEERLRLLNEEEAMLNASEPTHPEYLAMMQCVDSRRDGKLQIIEAEFRLNRESLQRWAVAGRAQIMSQYYQDVRKTREKVLEELGDEWYRIQQQRRSHANSVADFTLHYPETKSKALKQAIAYNKEVSILSGIAKHRGFPGAPEISGATAAEVEDDLDEIAQARRGGHHAVAVAATFQDYGAIPNERILGPAGAEFLKQTPWANPNHPSHQLPRLHNNNPPPGPHSRSPVSVPPPYRQTSTAQRLPYQDNIPSLNGASSLSPTSQNIGSIIRSDGNH